MRDRRRGFIYQTVPTLAALRERFDGREEADGKKLSLNTALGIYLVLTELANEQRRHDEFEETHTEIGRLAGSTRQTVTRYLGVFEEEGFLGVERRTTGSGREASTYVLLDPKSSETTKEPKSSQLTGGVNSDDNLEKVEEEEPSSLRSEAATRASANAESIEQARTLYASLDEQRRRILKPLADVAKARSPGRWRAEALLDLCEEFRDRDHVGEAESFRHFYIDGAGENVPVKSLVGRWRTWLSRAPSASKARRSRGPTAETARLERQRERFEEASRLAAQGR